MVLAVASVSAGVIYSHDFSGSSTENLDGVVPDNRPPDSVATWVASSVFKQDGSIVANAGSATLAFSPKNGKIYTLDTSLAGVTGTARGVWFGFGFAKGQSANTGTSYRFLGSAVTGRAWMNYKWDADNQHRALMNGTTSDVPWVVGDAVVSENIDLRIVLDTTGGAGSWAATWYAKWPGDAGYTKVRDTAGLLSEDITSVGLVVSGTRIGGTIKSFSLVEGSVNPDAPEIDAGSDWITWSGQAVQLAPMVVNNAPGDPQPALTYTWSANPAEGVVFSATNIESPTVTITKVTANPSVVTLTLAVNYIGSENPDVMDTVGIDVYDDACEAAKGTGGMVDESDFNTDCITDLEDLAEMLQTYLADYTITEPVAKP